MKHTKNLLTSQSSRPFGRLISALAERRIYMPLYLNELAPWERKNEYYRIIQLGKNVEEQTHTINTQTKAMIASQMASANAIIASQERIAEGIDAVSCGIGRVEQGIYELKATFEWGISEVVWQIEQNRQVLKSILEVLMAPLDTQAKERRKRAEEAYANGWIEDAEEEFLESEKLNKFDFSIHISLGMIYLLHKVDKQKALSYFDKAIKYSQPKSAFHASYALLHKALIKFDLGETKEAEKYTAEAIILSPNFSEALYQNAQYNAQIQNSDKSITNLEKAIKIDKIYCFKANKDAMFDPIRESVNRLFGKLRDEERRKAIEVFEKISEKQKASDPIIHDIFEEKIIDDASSWKSKSENLRSAIKRLNARIARNSYFDFLEINNDVAPKIQKDQDGLVSELKHKINSLVETFEQKISNAEISHKNKISEYLGNTWSIILSGSFVIPAILALFTETGWSKLLALVFFIPVFSQLVTGVMLYQFIINYQKQGADELVFGWGIVLYLAASIVYYLISTLSSKDRMKSEIDNQENLKERTMPYLERVKDI